MIRRTRDNARRTKAAVAIGIVVLLLATIVVGFSIAFGALRGIWQEQCRISDPELNVVITSNKDEQRRMVHPEIVTLWFGLTNGANLATIPFAKLRSKLLARIPNIHDLKIERRLPNRVTIDVFERDPAVRVAPLKGKTDTGLVADLDGVVFPFSSNVSALPVIREAESPGTAPGKRLAGMSAAALRLIEAAAAPELAGFSVLEVDTSHADYLLATLGDYSRAKIAWDHMLDDTRASRDSLQRQLKFLSQAIATRMITQPTTWDATDFGKPVYIHAKDPARADGQ